MKIFTNTNFTPINNAITSRNIYIYRPLEQINKFSTSAILLSQSQSKITPISSDQENLLRQNLSEIKSNSEFDFEKYNEDLKNIAKPVGEKEVVETMSKLNKYVQDHPNDMSSYEEAFPKLIDKATTDSDLSNSEESTGVVFNIVKTLYTELNNCANSGNLDENCVKNLKITELVKKVIMKKSEIISSEKIGKIGDLVKSNLENEGILTKIGKITLDDIYQKYKTLDEKILINISSNYKEIGFSMVSYGILINRYNKHVYNKPYPSNITAEDLKVLKTTRAFSRYWFAGLVAPLLLYSFHKIRENKELVKIDIDLTNSSSDSDINNTSLKNGSFLLFIINKIKNKLGSLNSFGIFSIITVLFFLLIFIFWYLDILNIINYISELKKIMMIDYLKYITFIVILIPMIINSVMIYILTRENKTSTEKNILVQDKYLPTILVKFRNSLRNIVNNKELKIYYISRCKAELFIYVFILIIYLIWIY